MWGGQIAEIHEELPLGISTLLVHSKDAYEEGNIDLRGKPIIIPAYIDGVLRFLHSDDDIDEYFGTRGKQATDQFGKFQGTKFVAPETIVMDRNQGIPTMQTWNYQDFVQAMNRCAVTCKEHQVDHFFVITIQGPEEYTMNIRIFWTSILPEQELLQVGYSMDCIQELGLAKIRFFPSN